MPGLLYHTGALGDFIAAIPALAFWQRRNRGERLVLLGKPVIGEFAQEIGLIDDYLDIDSSRLLPLFSENRPSAAADLLAPFTTAIIFSNPDSPLIRHCKERATLTVFWQPPFPSSRMPIVDYHLSLFADPSTIPPHEKIPRVTPPDKALADAEALLGADTRLMVLHPGSGSRKKNWPFDRFLSLANSLRTADVPILWLRGPADDHFEVSGHDLLVSSPKLSLCAALLSRCRAYAGNDSGITHMAAAAGCPTVAIFGASDPGVWAPRGEKVAVIYKHYECSPCHRAGVDDSGCGRTCLAAISVEEVRAAIESAQM
jgi:heptosyltransferase III